MDYEIRRNKSELDSTGYMEIGPGKYSGKHWQDGFLFIWEDAFGMAEGIIMKHFKDYDHFGMNDIPKDIGAPIATEWRQAATKLEKVEPGEYQDVLNLDVVYRSHMAKEIAENKDSIIVLLNGLAEAFDNYYENEDWVCILGI